MLREFPPKSPSSIQMEVYLARKNETKAQLQNLVDMAGVTHSALEIFRLCSHCSHSTLPSARMMTYLWRHKIHTEIVCIF